MDYFGLVGISTDLGRTGDWKGFVGIGGNCMDYWGLIGISGDYWGLVGIWGCVGVSRN